jgi:hypothetical protein
MDRLSGGVLALEEGIVATPADTDYVISQGDSLPLMRIPIPPNSAGELIDLTGCTVTFLGRVKGDRSVPPPIIRPIERFAREGDVVAVYVKHDPAQTKLVSTGKSDYLEMEGELEVKDASNDKLTITGAGVPYMKWWIRDDIGDGA